jgi:hypothetical protein
MDRARLWATLPYLILLALTAWLFTVAGTIEYDQRPGQLGPDFWPKLALGLMAAASLLEIARVLLFGAKNEPHGIADTLEEGEAEEDSPRSLPLLLGGVVLTLAYGMLITVLGFPLATSLYLVSFMYLGGYRSHIVIWLSGLIGTALIATIFLNVVYVSLPRGVPPFDRVTDAIIGLF